jgi:outer membrane protein
MRNTIRGLCNKRALAFALAVAVTPAAFAQDDTSTTDTAAHRFNVVGGYAHMVPKSDPGTLAGTPADLDGNGAPTLSGSWFVNDNVAVELWGAAGKFEHGVNLANGARGNFKSQPIAVSGQYHFGTPQQAIRPYVGLGYYQANIDEEHFDATVAGADHVGLDSPNGPIASVGADFNITDRWFARADARYMQGDAEAKIAGNVPAGELALDPWVVGVGIGTRF